MKEQGMKLEDFYIALKKRWVMISILILIPVILVLLMPTKIISEDEFEATSRLQLEKNYRDVEEETKTGIELSLFNNLIEYLKSNKVLKEATGIDSLEEINELISNFTISAVKDSYTINLTMKGKTEEIETILNKVVSIAEEDITNIIPNYKITVINEVELNPITMEQAANNTKKAILVFIGMAFLATLLAITLEYFDDSFKHEEDLERDLNIQVLARLFRKNKNNRNEIAYKKLATTLQFNYKNVKSILITSTLYGENKVECVSCLADNLSELGNKVIVINLDKDQVVTSTNNYKAIQVNEITNIETIIKENTEKYQYVLLNGTDTSNSNMSQITAKYVDGTIFVVKAYKAKRKFVASAIKELTSYNDNIVGIVINNIEI